MNKKIFINCYLLILAVMLIPLATAQAATLYVGTSWPSTQYPDIQSAITAAADTDEIWVEQGTYALTAMINVNKKVAIYGGFTGSETARSQRDWVTNVTTVDGQNTVGCFYTTVDATIDGFTITRGYKSGSGDVDKGAGILNGDPSLGAPPADAPDLTVANCIFYRNESFLKSGGAICNFTSAGNLTITASIFTENFGDEQGGAIRVQKGNTTITDCVFTGNKIKKDTGGVGGAVAISNTAGTAVIERCTFTENKCRDAGAVSADVNVTISRCIFKNNNPVIAAPRYGTVGSRGDLPVTVTNCLFYGNRVQYGGGIAINGSGTNENLNVMNCTFANNILVGTGATGGAIYSLKTGGTAFNVTNCILWGNTNTNEIAGPTGFLAPTVSYTDTDQTVAAGSNINQDPLFVGSGDYHLQTTPIASPCIDTGTNSGAPNDDLEGKTRPQGLGYDMGAYETYNPVTLIELSSFTAIPSNKEVVLKWSTASEIDNAGFNIYRAGADGEFAKINAEIILAKGSSTSGAAYEFVDNGLQNRKSYSYQLEDIDLNGSSTMHGPVSAIPRWIYVIGK